MPEPFLLRLPFGGDLLEEITRAFAERDIRQAVFQLIGAVKPAVLGFYDPVTRKYQSREFPGMWEVVSCMGNISEKDGAVFTHAHATISSDDYQCMGGHLMPGSKIFAAELHAIPIPGTAPVRKFDDVTGLFLWSD
jgi:predicted DNA-binding protein with PD1-like motif